MNLRPALYLLLAGTSSVHAAPAPTAPDEFVRTIRPILEQNCSACHNGKNARGPANFLSAQTAKDLEARRGLWHNVAMQLRNRTMPPVESKLTEQDRLHIASWVDAYLQRTACSGQPYAGAVTVRRLNRREYRNTIRDLLGVDFEVSELFPEDGTGGEGFDTNADTLYLPPIMMERYLQAAKQILDRAIVTPAFSRSFSGSELQPTENAKESKVVGGTRRTIGPTDEVTAPVTVYADGPYTFAVSISRSLTSPVSLDLKADGKGLGTITMPRYESKGATGGNRQMQLTRGSHTIAIVAKGVPTEIIRVEIAQRQQEAPADRRALHLRLFGMEPGQPQIDSRAAAQRLLASFVAKAYRRPLEPGELDPYLKLYDRAAERGDPYEERIKLALEGVLVSPKFLFRVEKEVDGPGVHPLTSYEVASRLSYFLWSTTPDDELRRLAAEGRLHDPKVLSAQVDRMLADPRSRVLAETFIGQWLGTKELGISVVPALNDLQDFYTPDVASDLRQEPVLLFHYMLTENRPVLDLLDANYSFLTSRLVRFYQMEDQFPNVRGNDFQRVEWPDKRRGGVFGMGAMLAMTSHFKQTSPVLRGAWVLDTMLGTAVPPPPPDVPPLEASGSKTEKLTVREKLTRHRANASCATCHSLIDPIGFGLENFDWMGRWRDTDNGKPVDASASMPSGEKLTGPAELRQAMLKRKDEFLRNVSQKVLGYALGRGLQDGDQCTVQQIMQAVAKEGYGTRALVREVVLSTPFRNSQRVVNRDPAPATVKRKPKQLAER